MESEREDTKLSSSLFEYAIESLSKQSSQSSPWPSPSSSSPLDDIRLFVQGPTECGKTSLLMNLAYSIAKNTIRRGERGTNDGCGNFNDNGDNGGDDKGDLPVVTFLVPTKNKSNLSFPLICSPLERQQQQEQEVHHKEPLLDEDDIIDDDDDDSIMNPTSSSSMLELKSRERQFQKRMEGLDNQLAKVKAGGTLFVSSSTIDNRKRKRTCMSTSTSTSPPLTHNQRHCRDRHNWNTKDHATALKKIQIKYVDSVLDLMQYLATLPMHTASSSPTCRAIIIDDLDYFIRDHDLCNTDESAANDIQEMGEGFNGHNRSERDYEDTYERNNRGYHRRDYSPSSRASISKTLFHDSHDNNNHLDEQSKNNNYNNNNSTGNSSSTVQMMRLVQLLAHISDTCNQLNKKNISTPPTSFVTSINTDRLQLPKQQQLSVLIQNYVSTIATIREKNTNEEYDDDNHKTSFSRSYYNRSKKEGTLDSCDLHNILNDGGSFTRSFSSTQISSLWEINFEHDIWKNMFHYSGNYFNLPGSRNENSSKDSDDENIKEENIKYHQSLLYAVVWTFDQEFDAEEENDGVDGSWRSSLSAADDEEEECIDFEAKEIVWRKI